MPRSKRVPRHEMHLNIEGCRIAAQLYIDECERRDGGQEELCSAENINSTTGSKLKTSFSHGLPSIPETSTVMRLGRQITVPTAARMEELGSDIRYPNAGQKFDPWVFLALCSGRSAKDLVRTALSIDSLVLEEFPRPTAKAPQINLKAVGDWFESAPIEAQIALAQLVRSRFAESGNLIELPAEKQTDPADLKAKSTGSQIAQLTRSYMGQIGASPAGFAKRCKLTTDQIKQVINSGDVLTREIAEGLSRGFSVAMEGWSGDMIMKIDPTRFPVSEVRGSGGGSSGGSPYPNHSQASYA